MSQSWFETTVEQDHDFGRREPTAYERSCEEARQARLVKQQIRKYGEDAMKADPQVAVGAQGVTTEPFERSLVLRMPGSTAEKKKEKDPLASLLKAMQIDVTKTRATGDTDGKSNVRAVDKGDGKFHGSHNRYPRRGTDRQPTEVEPLPPA